MRRKKVIFAAPPFKGHLHPILGLAMAVRDVADVLLLSTPSAEAECGLPFQPLLAAHESKVWEIAEPGVAIKSNPVQMWRQLKRNVALMAELKKELLTLFQREKPDLVIADFTLPVAGLAAMECAVPWWTTMPSPCVLESPDGPPAYFGGQTPDGSAILQAAMRFGTRMFKSLAFFLFKRELQALGLQSLYRADGSERVYSSQRILVIGMREIEFPQTWPQAAVFVGPVYHTPKCGDREILFDERPHVLVTLGTHLPHAKNALSQRVQKISARHPELVFHFTYGRPGRNEELTKTANFCELPYVSYAEHIQRYALVVHHAGTGILHHCLRHGVPSVAHPQDFDQFDNAARLARAGLAVVENDPDRLEAAILRALEDRGLHQKCRDMAQIARRYDAPAQVRRMVVEQLNPSAL